MSPWLIAVIIIFAVIILIVVTNIKIVPQANAFVIERFGVYYKTWHTGIHVKLPFMDRIARRVSLKEQVVDFEPQSVITRDNVSMQIDTVVYFQITDSKLYAYGVERPIMAIETLCATTLRNIIGELELDNTLTSRDKINERIREILDEATDAWGIKVKRVELKNILPPREIQIAMEKQEKTPGLPGKILYLLQDIREFELYGTVRAVISSCDSLNYLTREEDLLQAFCLVNNYLDPGGLFLFDMNTVYACETLLADHTFAESREDCSFIWENYYDPDSMLNEYDLTLFLRKDAGTPGRADDRSREELPDGSLYQRYTETHLERAYPLEKVKELLERAGMEYITAFDGYSSEPCTDRSERMLILARERGKKL